MANLAVELLPWQQQVFNDKTRFKIIAAGRRTGKSRLAAWTLIINALQTTKGHVFYVAPTQGQARDILWSMLHELAHPVIKNSHINNMQITLINGATIALKGADRPETLRGVSLKYVVLDEYADMKPQVFEQILRPALADQQGEAMFIGTPLGRNHFYDLYMYGMVGDDSLFKSWHFTSFDNPLIPKEEIELAKKSMSSFAFRQEFMASFEAAGSEVFKEEWLQFCDKKDWSEDGQYFISVDLAGFNEVDRTKSKNSKLDQSAISVVKVNENGWFVEDIIYGRWPVKETAEKIFNAVAKYQPTAVGIERGIAKQAVMSPLEDLMKSRHRFFRVEELTHGNQKKVDRIVWALQGRFENGLITLNKGDWNATFMDELLQFPNRLVHDDLIDSLAYIDQMASVCYNYDYEEDDFEFLDPVAGY